MIHHLSGKLVEKYPTHIIIECGGVGYLVHISLNTFDRLSDSEALKIYTHQIIREDAHTLYGFAEPSERELFIKLISVSGVGASTARMMLSGHSPSDLVSGIVNEDVAFLKSIKGIGAKTAERIIVDLKDKLGAFEGEEINSAKGYNTTKDEALSALIALGFDRKVSNKILDKILGENPDLSVERLVKEALKNV